MGECVVCGKKSRTVKLPFGTIDICSNMKCLETLMYNTHQCSALVWIDISDFDRDFIPEGHELRNEIANMNADTFRDLTTDMADFMWNGDMLAEMFNETLEYGAKTFEHNKIKSTEKKNLPLLIDRICFDENRNYLEERLKNEQD